MFASLIAFDGTTFVNEPFGSDKLGEGDELLLGLGLNSGLKYFNILEYTTTLVFPKEQYSDQYCFSFILMIYLIV